VAAFAKPIACRETSPWFSRSKAASIGSASAD
jgi:hypothetical protein